MVRYCTFYKAAFWLLLSSFPLLAAADHLLVVVNPGNPISTLTKSQVSALFLKRKNEYEQGFSATPYDQKNLHLQSRFYRLLTGKPLQEIHAYWDHMSLASGRVSPRRLTSHKEVIQTVARDPQAISYIDPALILNPKELEMIKVVLFLKNTAQAQPKPPQP